MSIHIERYLLGRAEFETTINHITVDFRSFLHHFSTINLALTLALDAANLAYQPRDEPLPSIRDVGSVDSTSAPSQARMQPHLPLPFQRDVGGLVSLEGGSGEGGRRGGCIKWNAPVVSYETRATTFVMVRFRHPSSNPHY